MKTNIDVDGRRSKQECLRPSTTIILLKIFGIDGLVKDFIHRKHKTEHVTC